MGFALALTHYEGPYQIAEEVGLLHYRETGRLFLPELVVASVVASLQTTEGTFRAFYDHPTARLNLRRNVFLIADRDSKKGSILRLWSNDIVGMTHISDDSPGSDERLRFMTGSGGVTFESLRGGGGQGGNLKLPVFPVLNFIIVPEAMSWFGHDPRRRSNIIDQLNTAMEDVTIDVSLDKMATATPAARKKFKEACATIGANFDVEFCMLSYDCKTGFVFASRTPDDKTWDHMLESGFLSRCALVEWDPDPETYRAYKVNQIGPGWPEGVEALRAFHDRLAKTTWDKVPYPPMEMVNEAMASTQQTYDTLMSQTSVRQDYFEISRELQYFAQLMTFNAVCRMLKEAPGVDHFHTVVYEREDIDFATRHFNKYVYPIVERRAMSSIERSMGRGSVIEEALPILNDFIRFRVNTAPPPDGIIDDTPLHYQQFGGGEFYRFYITKKKMTNPSFQARLRELVEAGYIRPEGNNGNERIYEVLNTHMKTLGFRTIKDYDEEFEKQMGDDVPDEPDFRDDNIAQMRAEETDREYEEELDERDGLIVSSDWNE